MIDPALTSRDRRILVISEVGCPPPFQGNRVRMAALLDEIRRLGYSVHFAGVDMSDTERASVEKAVDEWVWHFRSHTHGPQRGMERIRGSIRHRLTHTWRILQHDLDERFERGWLAEARALQERGRYSRVIVAYVFHSKFLEAFRDAPIRILDTHDVFANRRERLRAHGVTDYWFSIGTKDEQKALQRANRVIAIQEDEAAYFRGLVGKDARVYTVGHLLDPVARLGPSATHHVGYIGSGNPLNVHGMRWFLDQVWPTVLERVPDASLSIGGEVAVHLPEAPRVQRQPHIQNLSDFYGACDIIINPMQIGTGLKIKNLEALSYGRVVITTPVGAAGLEQFVDHGLMVCNSAQEFAETAIAFLENPERAAREGQTALHRVSEMTERNRTVLAQALT